MKIVAPVRSLLALALLSCAGLASAQVVASNPASPPRICIDDDCHTKPAPGASKQRKWHPGHYVSVDGRVRAENREEMVAKQISQMNKIANEPTVKGIQIMVQWSALEGAKPGDYAAGMEMIQQYLDAAARINKYVMISINERQFGEYTAADLKNNSLLLRFWPEYIVKDSKYGITLMKGGLTARVWQQATMDRIIALVKAYGERFDSHPNVEMVTASETSFSFVTTPSDYSYTGLADQLKRLNVAARQAWPTTGVRVSTNFMAVNKGTVLNDFMAHMGQQQMVFGGPDVIPNYSIQANNILSGKDGGIDYRVKHPIVAEVQSPSLGGKEGTFTPKQLYEWAANELKPQYYVWVRNTWMGGDAQKWDTGILPYIRSINGKVPTTACPASYTGGCKQ